MAPRRPAKNATGLDKETAGLLRQSGRKAKARQAGSFQHNDEVRQAYADRVGLEQDDVAASGPLLGRNFTNLSETDDDDE